MKHLEAVNISNNLTAIGKDSWPYPLIVTISLSPHDNLDRREEILQ